MTDKLEKMNKALSQKIQNCSPARSVHGPVSCKFLYRLSNNQERCVLLERPSEFCRTYLEIIRGRED